MSALTQIIGNANSSPSLQQEARQELEELREELDALRDKESHDAIVREIADDVLNWRGKFMTSNMLTRIHDNILRRNLNVKPKKKGKKNVV